METVAERLGLLLNKSKSKVICKDSSTLGNFLSAAPAFHVTHPTLLGSHPGDSIDDCINEKRNSFLRVMEGRFQHLHGQDATLVLCMSLAIPRLMYLLRGHLAFFLISIAGF